MARTTGEDWKPQLLNHRRSKLQSEYRLDGHAGYICACRTMMLAQPGFSVRAGWRSEVRCGLSTCRIWRLQAGVRLSLQSVAVMEDLRMSYVSSEDERREPPSVARRRHIPSCAPSPDISHAPRLTGGLDRVWASPGQRLWRCALPSVGCGPSGAINAGDDAIGGRVHSEDGANQRRGDMRCRIIGLGLETGARGPSPSSRLPS